MKKIILLSVLIVSISSCASKSNQEIAKEHFGTSIIYDNIEEQKISHEDLIQLAIIEDGKKLQSFIDRVKIESESIIGMRDSDRLIFDEYKKMAKKVSSHSDYEPDPNAEKDYTLVIFKNGTDVIDGVPIKNGQIDLQMIEYLNKGYYHVKMNMK
jgi:hypothetical protein